MTKEEIIPLVTSYINQALDGQTVEHPKFDFKREWYDLTSENGVNSFLKDSTAIVNSIGPDGFIVIGFDERGRKFYPAKFADSKKRDTSEITQLINKHVDRLFDVIVYDITIDGNYLSIIHIPPSMDKPHMIKNYRYEKDGKTQQEENRIFVRKGTTIQRATRADLDFMFYDNKNIIPEYKLVTSLNLRGLSITYKDLGRNTAGEFSGYTTSNFPLTIENIGRRPVAIIKITVRLYMFEDSHDSENIILDSGTHYYGNPLIVNSNDLNTYDVTLSTGKVYTLDFRHLAEKAAQYVDNKSQIRTKAITYELNTGTRLNSDLRLIY